MDYQSIDTSDQAVIVTASRNDQAQSDTAASTTVIDGATIERIGEPLTLDFLRLTPSAAVSVSGSEGSQAQVRIRGAEANHTLLFVDGVRANDPAAANEPRFELLNADLASRVEIVRGPQSALWGSEAIGGVVAVDGSADPATEGVAEFGSNQFYRAAGNGGFKTGDLTVALGAGVQGSEGIDAFDTPGVGDRDGYWNVTLRGRAALALGGGNEVGFNGFAVRAGNQFDGFNSETFSHDDTLDNTRNRLAAGRAWFSHKAQVWDARLAVSLLGSTNRNFLDDTFLNQTEAKRWTISGQVSRSFDAGALSNRVTVAAEGEKEDYRASDEAFFGATDQHRTRNHGALTGEWQAELGQWFVTDLAVRHDAFNRFKNATTARASALFKIGDRFGLAASWGEGIAQPSFTDLYGFFPNGYAGNPEVKPERSKGWEVSARYGRGPVRASLTYFSQKLEDEIVENATFTSVLNADGTSKRQGVEAELHWSPGAWLNLSLGYAWLDATQQVIAGQPEQREFRRPKHSGSISADGQRGRLSYGASLAYTGKHLDRRDSFPFELNNLDSYWLATARLGWRIDKRFELFGRIHNAFDADYEDAVGYQTEGRSVFGGLRVSFGR